MPISLCSRSTFWWLYKKPIQSFDTLLFIAKYIRISQVSQVICVVKTYFPLCFSVIEQSRQAITAPTIQHIINAATGRFVAVFALLKIVYFFFSTMIQVFHRAGSHQLVTITLVGISTSQIMANYVTCCLDSTIDNESRISSRHYHTMDMKRYSLRTVQDIKYRTLQQNNIWRFEEFTQRAMVMPVLPRLRNKRHYRHRKRITSGHRQSNNFATQKL